MKDYQIPNSIIKSIDKRCKSSMIGLYIFLTFALGVATQLYLVINLFR